LEEGSEFGDFGCAFTKLEQPPGFPLHLLIWQHPSVTGPPPKRRARDEVGQDGGSSARDEHSDRLGYVCDGARRSDRLARDDFHARHVPSLWRGPAFRPTGPEMSSGDHQKNWKWSSHNLTLMSKMYVYTFLWINIILVISLPINKTSKKYLGKNSIITHYGILPPGMPC
jgi:hypothetical protein